MAEHSSFYLVDTNVLVYAYENEQSARKQAAQLLLDECWMGRTTLFVSSQNLAEFSAVMIEKGKIDGKEVAAAVQELKEFNGFKKINYSSESVMSAINVAAEYNLPFWDALLAVTMKDHGIFNIYTENVKDFKIPWIKAVNPL